MPTPEPDDQTLEALLAFHGLSHWQPLLAEWLGRFEGWHTAFELYEEPTPDFVPQSQVMFALAGLQEPLNGCDLDFAALLSDLDFVTWRASRSAVREGWDPLSESFRTFASRGPVKLWEDDRPFAAGTTIRYWLLGRLYAEGRGAGVPDGPAAAAPQPGRP